MKKTILILVLAAALVPCAYALEAGASFGRLPGSASEVSRAAAIEVPAVPVPAFSAAGEGAVPGRKAPDFDAARASKLAQAAAAGNIGAFKGKCYEYVSYHMEAAGIIRPEQWSQLGIGPDYAADFAEWAANNPDLMLRELGLHRMPTPSDKMAVPVGSILVYERGACGFSRKAGHIEVVTAPDQACSDGCESLDQACFADPAEAARIYVIIPVS